MTSEEAGLPELTAVRAEHQFDEAALQAYLVDLGLVEQHVSICQFEGGQSNPTFLLQADGARYVLRKQPPGEILPSAHRVDREYKVMSALANVPGVPVPTMHAYCADSSIIGTPFYVMDFVAGRVLSNPALPELEPVQRRRVHHGLIDTLAALHAVAPEAVGLTDFGRPSGYFERQVKRWRKQYAASIGTPDPNMTWLGDWLAEHVPADAPAAIAHGDFRLGNLVMAADTSHVVAVLDWELATLGHPLADLAYACMPYYLPPGEVGIAGLEGLDLAALGIPAEQALVERYCAARGIAAIQHWPAFVAFALYRMAAILQGVSARAQAGNASSDNARRVGDRAGLMAQRGVQVARQLD